MFLLIFLYFLANQIIINFLFYLIEISNLSLFIYCVVLCCVVLCCVVLCCVVLYRFLLFFIVNDCTLKFYFQIADSIVSAEEKNVTTESKRLSLLFLLLIALNDIMCISISNKFINCLLN